MDPNRARLGLNPALRLALVAGAGAWAGHALFGNRIGAVAGAAASVLLVESEVGRQLLEQGAELVNSGRIPPIADVAQERERERFRNDRIDVNDSSVNGNPAPGGGMWMNGRIVYAQT